MKSPAAHTEKAIGAALRRARVQAGLTQEELAERAHLSLPTIKQLENGRGSRLSSLVQALDVLGLADGLVPAVPAISPMQILQNRRRAPAVRVRHAKART